MAGTVTVDKIHVEAKRLEYFAGHTRRHRKPQSALWPFSLDGFTSSDYELKGVIEIQHAGAVKHVMEHLLVVPLG